MGKFYLFISLFVLVVFGFTIYRCLHYISNTYNLSEIKKKTDSANLEFISFLLEMFVISFFPVFNVIFCMVLIFEYDYLQDEVEKQLLEKLDLKRKG